MPINDRLNMWPIHTMEYYAAIKKNEFMSFVGTWMKLETIILSKLTQEQKTKDCIFSLIHDEQLEHMDTGRGTSHTRAYREEGSGGEGYQGVGGLGRNSIRRNNLM